MGYHVQDIVSWYQKKIGTYDKQQWEKTVEQRILSGLTHIPMKSAKLKTELIDVDLVRGSAFTKAKPKHGILTVTRLAALRLFFMPFYYQWWICQTSSRIFIALIVLYSLQLFNTFLYFSSYYLVDTYHPLENIPPSEVLVPFAMMLVLSIIHSQIVSTHSSNGRNKNNKNEESRNHIYVRRLKRTRRRNISASKIRSIHPETKESSEAHVESSNSLSDNSKFNQRLRLKKSCEKSYEKNARTVMWKATPSKQRYREFLLREDGVPKNACCHSTPSSQNDVDPQEGISSRGADEETPPPTMDDDGFESLDGNGSSDCKEEQDISLTADEFETALKNNPVRGDSFDNGLVILKCCPKFSKQNGIVPSHNDDCEGRFANQSDALSAAEHCVEMSKMSKSTEHGDEAPEDVSNAEPKIVYECADKVTDTDGNASEVSESVSQTTLQSKKKLLTRRRGSQQNLTVTINKNLGESSYNSSGDESEDGATLSSPCSFCPLTEGTTSAGEWVGVTTNSEECSYSSELEGSDGQFAVTSDISEHPFAWEMEMMPNVILSPSCAPVGKVSCTMWEKKDVKKANLSVLDISSAIIARVEAMPENVDYFYIGIMMSVILSTIPCIYRLTDTFYDGSNKSVNPNFGSVSDRNYLEPYCPIRAYSSSVTFAVSLLHAAFGPTFRERVIISIALFERFFLAAIFFFLLTVAERTFKQRFLYAKFFSHLTSFRRAKKSELPHFRLNKVRNIKSWLSVRSYLKKRGPQRSVDVIVSTSFLITVILLSFLSVELLKDSEYNVEALGWCVVIGFFMLRFMTLGTKVNRKYRNLSTLITEQINLYLQIEQKPNKKEELMVANSVLKLAADLLKELESPFKISGFSANPYLYTVTKVVMLSALSGILSEFLGFKLKLHKIKIK